MMLDRLDEVEELLNEIYEETPKILLRDLNGGIVIEEEICYHPESVNNDLVCLGAYKRDLLGRNVVIYYGSMMKMYGHLSREGLKEELKKVLYHELTHHNEYLAKEYGLEIADREFLDKYKENRWIKDWDIFIEE